jgi:hypothetical protein
MKKTRDSAATYRSRANPFATPFAELMIKSSEIMLASGQTVFYRTLMMAGANAAALTDVERREFTRMYTEKLQAAMECGQIMASEMVRLNQQFAMMAWTQFLGGGMAMASLTTGRNPAGTIAAQNRFMNNAAKQVGDATQKIATAVARAAAKGLKPVHTTASANARRLGRNKR